MEKSGVRVYMVGRTNLSHIKYLQQRYGKDLPGRLFLSYEQKKLGADLTEVALRQIKDLHPEAKKEEIMHLRKDPGGWPYPSLWNLGRWPFQVLEHIAKRGAFSAIEQQAQKLGFTVLDWRAEQTLIEALSRLNRMAGEINVSVKLGSQALLHQAPGCLATKKFESCIAQRTRRQARLKSACIAHRTRRQTRFKSA